MKTRTPILLRRSRAVHLWIGAVIAGLLLAACSPGQPPEPPTPTQSAQLPTAAPTALAAATAIPSAPTASAIESPTPMPDFLAMPTLARGYLTTPNELRRIAGLARSGIEPYQAAVKAELDYAK